MLLMYLLILDTLLCNTEGVDLSNPRNTKSKGAISGANSKSHTEPLFKFYNILKVDDIFTYKFLTFYWKAKQAQLPKYLSKFLPELSEGTKNTQLITQIQDFNFQFISMSILKEHVDTS